MSDTTINRETVFTPFDIPEHTYVDRKEKEYEEILEDTINLPNRIVSIAGPSKSGKTVLVKKAIKHRKRLLEIPGARVDSLEDLGKYILNEINVPDSEKTISLLGEKTAKEFGGSVSGLLGLIKASLRSTIRRETVQEEIEESTFDPHPIDRAIDELEGEDIIIFIDDFHYIPRETQRKISELIKTTVSDGLTYCVALVPHRGDDVLRANTDLEGRVVTLDIEYWDDDELAEIADLGFSKLNVDFPDEIKRRFITESAGSPQLMQHMCLRACNEMGVKLKRASTITPDLSEDEVLDVFKRVARSANVKSKVRVINSGPKTRGKERNQFNFEDGSGDVYRCILRAIARDPPMLSFTYSQLKQRTNEECIGGSPSGSSISRSCEQMDELLKEDFPEGRYLDWDSTGEGYLSITNPYLLIYLRWGNWQAQI